MVNNTEMKTEFRLPSLRHLPQDLSSVVKLLPVKCVPKLVFVVFAELLSPIFVALAGNAFSISSYF